MPYLFPNFLGDPVEYAGAEALWRSVWERVEAPSHWTTPWLTTRYGNGQPFRDGDPIFSAFSLTAKRAIRIRHWGPVVGDVDFSAGDSFFGSGDDRLSVLHIDCAPTEESVVLAVAAMRKWVHATAGEG